MKRHLIASLLLGFLVLPSPQLFACSTGGCFGYGCVELLNDVNFDQLCSDWGFSNGATLAGGGGGDYYAQLSGDDTGELVTQTVAVSSGVTTQELVVGLDINKTSAGSERLKVEIAYGSTIDVIDVIYANANSSGPFRYNISNYAGQTITVRFLVIAGASPGDTIFNVQTVELFGTNI